MALFNKAGNILRHIVINKEMSFIFQTIRHESNWELFVGGVGRAATERSLREGFSKFGEITKAKVIMDKKTGRSRGFGFVTFAVYEDAVDAINVMDQWELDSRTVTVRWAKESGGVLTSHRSGPEYTSGDYDDSDSDSDGADTNVDTRK